jgi:chromosome segregation ATPase
MDRLDRLQAAIEELTARVDALTQRLELNEARLTQIMDTMNRLPNIVSSHEERLEDLEGR